MDAPDGPSTRFSCAIHIFPAPVAQKPSSGQITALLYYHQYLHSIISFAKHLYKTLRFSLKDLHWPTHGGWNAFHSRKNPFIHHTICKYLNISSDKCNVSILQFQKFLLFNPSKTLKLSAT